MIKVKVPATSANMGPGFDCMGVAVGIYNTFGFKETDGGLVFKGIPEEFCNEDNIIYTSMITCFKKANYKFKGLEISILNQDIPISRGLGSSSSCIVGGLIGANGIMGNKFSREEILQMAIEIEGHPDNVAPAVLGGMVVAINENGQYYYDNVTINKEINFVPIIPNFRLSTKEARDVLPKELPIKDGVYNVGRAALMVAALNNGNLELLKYACKDSFHEKYRAKLINGFNEVKNEAYNNGAVASFLSGAGPTIMAVIDKKNNNFYKNMKDFLHVNNYEWSIHEVSIDNQGAIIIEGE